jgi:hypothetical protein
MNMTHTPPAPRADPKPGGMTLSAFCQKAGIAEWDCLWAWKMGLVELQLRSGALFITHEEIRRQQQIAREREAQR